MDERAKRRKTMLLSIRDGSAWTVMEKFATEYLSAFIVALGFAGQQLSLLMTLPQAITALIQMISQTLMNRYGRLRVLADSVFWQAVVLALIILAAFIVPFDALLIALTILITIYYTTGAIAGNAWVSLMGDIVPEKARSKFFGARARVSSVTGIAALIGAGLIIYFVDPIYGSVVAFGILFGIGVLARLLSYRYLTQSYDPGFEQLPRSEQFTLLQFVGKFRSSNFTRYALFMALFWLAIYTSAPFITYYQLQVLGFNYIEYTLLKIAFIISSIVALKYLARLCDEYGNRTVFFASGLGIALYVGAFGIFTQFAIWLVLDLIGGILWSAFSLSTANYLFDAVSSKKRALVSGYVTALRGAGILAGGALSAYAFTFATRIEPYFAQNEYQLIFLFTAALRIVLILAFIPLVKEVREVASPSIRNLIFAQVGTGLRFAAHTTFSTAMTPIRFAKTHIERFEEKELEDALRGFDDEPDKP
jgi:MFS family permease